MNATATFRSDLRRAPATLVALDSVLSATRRVTPLGLRQRAVTALGRWRPAHHQVLSYGLLRDFAERDPSGYHRFLWSRHLAYAGSYEVDRRLVNLAIHPARRLLFSDMTATLFDLDVDPGRDVSSVFEVGCSLGHQLRWLEIQVFTAATTLDGIDIDEYAVAAGTRHLRELGSRVRLSVADMCRESDTDSRSRYDVVLSLGVLMYADEQAAYRIVRSMLRRADALLVISSLAHPSIDNRRLTASIARHPDGALAHNIDAMVEAAGGTVMRRRWQGDQPIEGQTIYFLLAVPPAAC